MWSASFIAIVWDRKHFTDTEQTPFHLKHLFIIQFSIYITTSETSLEYQYQPSVAAAEWIHLTFDAKTVFYTTRALAQRYSESRPRVINKCAYVSKYLNGAYK